MANQADFVITLGFGKESAKHVTLAFTIGLKSLEKGNKTAIILLLDGVHTGLKGETDKVDFGEPFLPVKDMMEVYFSEGGELLICGSCWKHDPLPDSERMSEAKMITADDVVELLMNAKGTLQLN
jgi:tRNA 2-thiouridine synthesizing protein D